MANYGFVRVAAASPKVKVGDCDHNTSQILTMAAEAHKKGVSAIVFPETCITGYSVQDLFLQRILIDRAVTSLGKVCEASNEWHTIIIVGLPLEVGNRLYNVAAVIYKGKIMGIVPKTFLPNYNEFYEKRWFSSPRELTQKIIHLHGQEVPIGVNMIFQASEFNFAIEICEDLWTPIPPSSLHSLHGAEVIFNLSASNEVAGKHEYRQSLISQQSARCLSAYIYASAGAEESTTDVVYSGCSMIAENGTMLAQAERFSFESQMIVSDIDVERLKNERLKNKSFTTSEFKLETEEYKYIGIENSVDNKLFMLNRYVNPMPFIPAAGSELDERCKEIFSIQVSGLSKRLLHTGSKTMIIGVSGGLDSTLALLVLVKVCDKLGIGRENVIGITMPGFGTSDRTYGNAIKLMEALGITAKEISIKEAVTQHLKDIDHDINLQDVTYENAQARERTQILMDYANKANGLVIGTGDLSELALGWCTYNGDHMSMYAVNTSIPKTLVRTLVRWVADTQVDVASKDILHDVVDTPVSPELLPGEDGEIGQITEDVIGPYVLHDFFLYYMLRFGFSPAKIYFLAQSAFKGQYKKEEILEWIKVFFRRFFSQQFKRSCLPDGPKVGSINLSPRGDWRMPSDASAAVWMKQIDRL